MPIDPRELAPYVPKEYYETEVPCKRCGYSLKGLEKGGRCPECGFQRPPSVLAARDNLLYAPLGYLKLLQLGASLMAIGVVGTGVLVGMSFFPDADATRAGVRLIVAVLWLAGVWIMTGPRQVSERTPANPRQEWKLTRWVNRGTQACWLLAAMAGLAALGGASPGLEILAMALATVGLFGLVPLAIQVADLAEWGADSGLASRLRGAAWGLMVFGLIVEAGSFAPLLLGPFAFFLAIPLLISSALWIISLLVFGYSVLQLVSMMRWAIVNSQHLAARDRRVVERQERDQRAAEAGRYRGVAGVALERENASGVCPGCGYSLEGLPPNSPCPECGNELSAMPIRRAPQEAKPAWLTDDSPIPLEPEQPGR